MPFLANKGSHMLRKQWNLRVPSRNKLLSGIVLGVCIRKKSTESRCLNSKAYIFGLFLRLELRGPNVLFSQPKREKMVTVLRKCGMESEK